MDSQDPVQTTVSGYFPGLLSAFMTFLFIQLPKPLPDSYPRHFTYTVFADKWGIIIENELQTQHVCRGSLTLRTDWNGITLDKAR